MKVWYFYVVLLLILQIKALRLNLYNIPFARIENSVGSKQPLVVIGTIQTDFGDFCEIVSKVQAGY